MAKDLLIISACSMRAGLLPQYEEQLEAAHIDFCLHSLTEALDYNLGSIGQSVRWIRRWLDEEARRYQKIVISDAWDVLFFGSKEEVMAKIPDDDILLCGDRCCWPDTYLQNSIPETGTPWRYVNGGLLAGTPKAFLAWCDSVELHPAYAPQMINQQWLNWMRLLRSPLTSIDYRGELFYNMLQEQGELGFTDGRPYNTLSKTSPNFIHFAGKTEPTNFFLRQRASQAFTFRYQPTLQ